MRHSYEVTEAVYDRVGVTLIETDYTRDVLVDECPYRRHEVALFGPYEDAHNADVRIFVSWRKLDGRESFSLLVQDRDDDAYLNADACGTERYPSGPVFVRSRAIVPCEATVEVDPDGRVLQVLDYHVPSTVN